MDIPLTAAAPPGKHSWQILASLLPGMGFALPAGQAKHAASLELPMDGFQVPAGHSVNTRAERAPASGQKPPVGQSVQLDDPSTALKVPVCKGASNRRAFRDQV